MPSEIIDIYNPTHIYLAENSLDQIGALVKRYGYKRVLLIYGGESLVRTGNLQRITNSLEAAGVSYHTKGEVTANPDISFVRATLSQFADLDPALILAVGGGSVIDAAKSLAHGFCYEGDPLDFNRKVAAPCKALPVGVVLTLAASGSEMSNSCVISDRSSGFKGGFNSPTNYPLFALLDPTLTYTVPAFQTACGLVDIISHSFERYFSPSEDYELADYLALSVIRQIVELTPAVLSDPFDAPARRSMMICGSVSHNGWTSVGKNYRMPCHFVEHRLSGRHPDIAHGLGLSWLLKPFMEVNRSALEKKIVKLGSFVFQVTSVDECLNRFGDYISSLPFGDGKEDFGVSSKEWDECIDLLKQ